MALIKNHSSRLMNPLDQFFRTGFADLWDRELSTIPSVNISETKDKYQIEMAVPGMKKDDFNIEINRGIITISSEKESETKDEKNDFSRREYNYSSFTRSFTIPEDANPDKVDAKYTDGVLQLIIPKKEGDQKSGNRKIDIR